MTTFNAIIEPGGTRPVLGDAFSVVRTVTGLDTAQTITKAWLTIKGNVSATDDDADLQLTITTAANDDGQITDDGAGATSGEVTFTVATAAHYTDLKASKTYQYDIQLLLSGQTLPTTLEKGTVRWEPEVTKATS